MFLRSNQNVVIPAHAAYITPNPYGLEVRENQPVAFNDHRQTMTWYGKVGKGELSAKLRVLGVKTPTTLMLSVNGRKRHAKVMPSSNGVIDVDFGIFKQPKEAFLKFAVNATQVDQALGQVPAVQIDALILSGTSTDNAHFNLRERRNCASVHLGYPVPQGLQVAGFYNECTPETDPIHTYYEVCGWHRGYFGMQVNSASERRIIFSVWDAGDESVDRQKVSPENRVKLIAKGINVVADGFGNEGTGGHSHLVHDWTVGDTFRFYMTAEVVERYTTYTGWFYFAKQQAWGLIAQFRAPFDGQYMRGLYSFNENFGGETGQLKRRCRFGPAWVHDVDTRWRNLNTVRFTCDATGSAGDRIDFDGLVDSKNRFFLENGGFENWGHVKAGQTATVRQRTGDGPKITLPVIRRLS